MVSADKIVTWLQEALPEQIKFLSHLVEINSHTTNVRGIAAVQDIFEQEFRQLGFDVQRSAVASSGDVLTASNVANQDRAILLSGHVDTVHLPESSFKQFSIAGDRLIGPGVLDMKGGLVVMLWALKAIAQFGDLAALPLRIFLNSEEERGSPHTRGFITELARKSTAGLVFEWGRGDHGVITSRKAIALFELQASGKKAHSGNAHGEGRNAIDAISRAILAIHTLTDYNRGVTISANQIVGGSSPSTVPDFATAICDLRAPTNGIFEEVWGRIVLAASTAAPTGTVVKAVQTSSMPALEETESSSALFVSYQAAAARLNYSCSGVQGPLGGVSDANLVGGVGTPTIDGLGPCGDGAHTDSEYVVKSSIVPRTAALAVWLMSQSIGPR
jgi:glutamate carboxypeptidase